jgi:hypothetical protein
VSYYDGLTLERTGLGWNLVTGEGKVFEEVKVPKVRRVEARGEDDDWLDVSNGG